MVKKMYQLAYKFDQLQLTVGGRDEATCDALVDQFIAEGKLEGKEWRLERAKQIYSGDSEEETGSKNNV